MCKISDKLKLCTCNQIEDIFDLKHHWRLYQFEESKFRIVGELMPPQEFMIGKNDNKYNHEKLREMLNEGNCFDFDIKLTKGDILEIHLTCEPDRNDVEEAFLVYQFVFNGRKWVKEKHDPFDSNRAIKNGGKVLNSFDEG